MFQILDRFLENLLMKVIVIRETAQPAGVFAVLHTGSLCAFALGFKRVVSAQTFTADLSPLCVSADAEGKGDESQPERNRRQDHSQPSRQRAGGED